MAMVVVILNKPSALVRGVLRNTLLEPQSNVFIGFLDSRRMEKLVHLLNESNANAMVCLSAKKSITGFRFKHFGDVPNRTIVELDGLQFVKRLTKSEG